jgi:hypothetical protein
VNLRSDRAGSAAGIALSQEPTCMTMMTLTGACLVPYVPSGSEFCWLLFSLPKRLREERLLGAVFGMR